jgi:hypothetical protein
MCVVYEMESADRRAMMFLFSGPDSLLEDRDGSEKMDSGCIIELQRRGGRF